MILVVSVKQSSQVACVSEDPKCWEAWDTSLLWRGGGSKPRSHTRGERRCRETHWWAICLIRAWSGHRRSDQHWNRFKGYTWETSKIRRSVFGLFRERRFHHELNWTVFLRHRRARARTHTHIHTRTHTRTHTHTHAGTHTHTHTHAHTHTLTHTHTTTTITITTTVHCKFNTVLTTIISWLSGWYPSLPTPSRSTPSKGVRLNVINSVMIGCAQLSRSARRLVRHWSIWRYYHRLYSVFILRYGVHDIIPDAAVFGSRSLLLGQAKNKTIKII